MSKLDKLALGVGVAVLITSAVIGIVCLQALILMWLWNFVMPNVFPSLHPIGFNVALGATALLSIVGGFFKTRLPKN